MAKGGTKRVLEHARLAMGLAHVRASRYGIRECSGGYSSTNAGAGAGWEGMLMSDGGAISYMLNFKSNEAMKNLSMLTARPEQNPRPALCGAHS